MFAQYIDTSVKSIKILCKLACKRIYYLLTPTSYIYIKIVNKITRRFKIMNDLILVFVKLLIGFLSAITIINFTGKGNLAPNSASDQVQNYVLGGIIGGIIYNKNIGILE